MADWLNADAINALVDDLVLKLGDDAFAHDGRAHLYSGPSKAVSSKIHGFELNNHERAKRRADKAKAVLIDDTKIGQFLSDFEGVGIYRYFDSNPYLSLEEIKAEGNKVWRHASCLFVLSLWGDVTTTVSGADRNGVYYTAEIPSLAMPSQVALTMPEMLQALFAQRTKMIDHVNEIPLPKIKKLYSPENYDGAQRLICLAEHRLDLREARRDSSLEACLDFQTGREQYRVDRYAALQDLRPIYKKTATERRLLRQKAVQHFVADLLQSSQVSLEGLSAPFIPTTPSGNQQNAGHLSRR